MKSKLCALIVSLLVGPAGCSAAGASPDPSSSGGAGAATGHGGAMAGTSAGGSTSGASGARDTGGASTAGSGAAGSAGAGAVAGMGAGGGSQLQPTHPYPTCADESRDDCKCVRTSADPEQGQEVCVPTCGSLGAPSLLDCPVHESGEGHVQCIHTWMFLTDEYTHGCILTCQTSAECPDGMACGPGANGELFCGWARPI